MSVTQSAVPLETALIDIKTLSAATGRSVPTLERDDHAGRIPKPVRIGRSKRWRRSEISAWIEVSCPPRAEWEAMRAAQRHGRPR